MWNVLPEVRLGPKGSDDASRRHLIFGSTRIGRNVVSPKLGSSLKPSSPSRRSTSARLPSPASWQPGLASLPQVCWRLRPTMNRRKYYCKAPKLDSAPRSSFPSGRPTSNRLPSSASWSPVLFSRPQVFWWPRQKMTGLSFLQRLLWNYNQIIELFVKRKIVKLCNWRNRNLDQYFI